MLVGQTKLPVEVAGKGTVMYGPEVYVLFTVLVRNRVFFIPDTLSYNWIFVNFHFRCLRVTCLITTEKHVQEQPSLSSTVWRVSLLMHCPLNLLQCLQKSVMRWDNIVDLVCFYSFELCTHLVQITSSVGILERSLILCSLLHPYTFLVSLCCVHSFLFLTFNSGAKSFPSLFGHHSRLHPLLLFERGSISSSFSVIDRERLAMKNNLLLMPQMINKQFPFKSIDFLTLRMARCNFCHILGSA